MIRLDMEQGSQEWWDARLGNPTASRFHRIIAPKTLKASTAQEKLLDELLAEWMLGYSLDSWEGPTYLEAEGWGSFAQRGKSLEERAREWYELTEGVDVEPVGHILHDTRRVGVSPDGLVGEAGMVEIKCRSAAVHVGVLRGGDAASVLQVQGGLWIAERDWCDVVAYHPSLKPSVTRVWRDDEKVIPALKKEVGRFLQRMDEWRWKFIRWGQAPKEKMDGVVDFSAEVERNARVEVRGLDRRGRPVDIEAEGLLAICLQHEIDHLNGILYIDHISQLKRSLYNRKLQKMLKKEKPPTGE